MKKDKIETKTIWCQRCENGEEKTQNQQKRIKTRKRKKKMI